MVVVRAEWLDEKVATFILTILKKEQYKYSYGRAFLMDRIKSTTLKLPIVHNDDGTPYVDETHKFSDDGYVPDWTFMENYIKSLADEYYEYLPYNVYESLYRYTLELKE